MLEGRREAEMAIAPEQLRYQTWVLKVSIHCRGCKKRVKKLLHSIEGVYATTVDERQQMAMVTGDVDGETLVKKLIRHGRHAEILALKPTQQEEKNEKVENEKNKTEEEKGTEKKEKKNKTTDVEEGTDEEEKKTTDVEKEKADGEKKKEEKAEEKKEAGERRGDKEATSDEDREKKDKIDEEDQNINGGESSITDNKDSENLPAEKVDDKNQKNDATDPEKTDEKSMSKKNSDGGAIACNAQPQERHFHQPPAVSAVYYNTAQPNPGHGRTCYYYAGPPVILPHYVFAGDREQQRSHFSIGPAHFSSREELVSSAGGSSPYDMFSDENPNACLIM